MRWRSTRRGWRRPRRGCSTFAALARKHRVEPDALAALGEQMRAQLAAIEAGGERIAELDRELARGARAPIRRGRRGAERSSGTRPRRSSTRRSRASLRPLKLDAARFRTALAQAEPGPPGTDRVEFEVSTNPGAPFGPLTRIASGGELSRFILALKVALAEAGSARDDDLRRDRPRRRRRGRQRDRRAAGAAGASDRRCWSSPIQPAGRGAGGAPLPDREDATAATARRTTVRKLDADERREEIARMLSGAAITDEARAQAARLLEAA